MLNIYLGAFLIGLGLSVLSFVAGLDHLQVFGHPILAHHHHHGQRRAAAINAAAVTAFLAWFGGAGVVLHQVTAWAEGGIVVVALATGVLGGGSVNRFLRALSARERPLEATSLIGTIGRITSPIREGGTGEIVFVVNGTRKVSAAKSEEGSAVDKGVEVVIVRMDRGIAYVSTWDELPAITPQF